MIKKFLILTLTVAMSISLSACGSKQTDTNTKSTSSTEMAVESESVSENDTSKSQEDFKQRYNLIMKNIELLNVQSEYVGAVHATIWDNVGPDEVAKYIRYVKEGYNDEQKEPLITKAFGVSCLNPVDTREACELAEKYVEALQEMQTLIPSLDEQYKELNSTYGMDYDLSDLKEYYVESTTYANYASTIDGSYMSYTQTLNDYKTNTERLKKSAEIAY